ncbi:MAG: hypothetical protein CL930_07180 [Deltaproteobacteria bacterium]|nr:hypothetical protein [Deltaproteobacteria bacterium]MAY80551.1 hypothetical protein [Deltaproteobacteria bacterium]|tara:strand:- start:53 stop:595 length:543 start_codon:yes stop_codon:yes gene_type:complete
MTDQDPLNFQNTESSTLDSTGDVPIGKRFNSFVSGWKIIFILVLALVGYFAWVAASNFMTMGLRAKLAEAPHNLEGIRTAQLAHHSQHGRFRSVGSCPQELPGRKQSAWEGACADAFKTLGWAPSGAVRCQYMAQVTPGENESEDFKLTAKCDVDGDGIVSIFEASRNSPPIRITPKNIL